MGIKEDVIRLISEHGDLSVKEMVNALGCIKTIGS
jgi:hypothetical protein